MNNRSLLPSLLVVLLLVSSGVLILSPTVEKRQENSISKYNSVKKSVVQEYKFHAPITVSNDAELAVVSNSGTGSVNDPFIISGWNITGASIYGIHITGTTKHFRIENCWIESSSLHCINLNNVAPGTARIINNTCNNNGYGILLSNSGSSIVANNTCNNNSDKGIFLYDSSSSIVANNTCNNNGDNGIYLIGSSSSIITNNTFLN
ncbi:MAG: right-handed parallel beta-helix repeat-containing protein, partial [Candidatus Hodarchaeales archaeon]